MAEKAANEMALLIWNQRQSLYPKHTIYSVSSGLAEAQASIKSSGKPVVILEHADRMNDSTYVLRELLELPGIKSAVPYFWDPHAAQKALTKRVGSPYNCQSELIAQRKRENLFLYQQKSFGLVNQVLLWAASWAKDAL